MVPKPELRSLKDLTSFREHDREEARAQAHRNLALLKNPAAFTDEERQQQAYTLFQEVAQAGHMPHKVLYWLTYDNLDLVDMVEPIMRQVAQTDEEKTDVEKKMRELQTLRQEQQQKEQKVFRPREKELFEIKELVQRKIYNAIRYNDAALDLQILEETQLHGIPGTVSLVITQQGDSWGVNLVLKSTQISRQEEKERWEEFEKVFGNIRIDQTRFPDLVALQKKTHANSALNFCIGDVFFAEAPGHKDKQWERVAGELDYFTQTIGDVLGLEYKATHYSGQRELQDKAIQIQNAKTSETFVMRATPLLHNSNWPDYDKATIDGFVVGRTKESPRKTVGSFQDFQTDLQAELAFVSGIVDWFYQKTGVVVPDTLELHSPDSNLLEWMEQYKYVEKMQRSPNTLGDLGGHYELRDMLARDAQDFIRSHRGEQGVLKPANLILYGETGIGKTALSNGVAAELLTAGIPVYVLQAESFQRALKSNVKDSLTNLKKLFFHVLINSGAIFIRDFDLLVRPRGESDEYDLMHFVLLSELQRIKEEPSTWLIADTQYIGKFDPALLNAHRIGKHKEVPLEVEPVAVEHMIVSVIRRIDQEFHRKDKADSFETVRNNYSFDYQAVAAHIAGLGGMIPAQIEYAFREEMTAHPGTTIDAANIIARIDQYQIQRLQLQKLQEAQRADETMRRVGTLEATVAQLVGQNADLAAQLAAATSRVDAAEQTIQAQAADIRRIESTQRRDARAFGADLEEIKASQK